MVRWRERKLSAHTSSSLQPKLRASWVRILLVVRGFSGVTKSVKSHCEACLLLLVCEGLAWACASSPEPNSKCLYLRGSVLSFSGDLNEGGGSLSSKSRIGWKCVPAPALGAPTFICLRGDGGWNSVT